MLNSFAERITAFIGSWRFIILQTAMILIWMTVNHPGNAGAFDPYPWILLNLCMSTQAMYTGPVVMVSQNRQEAAMAVQRKHMEEMLEQVVKVTGHVETLDGRLEQEVELLNRKLDILLDHLSIFPKEEAV